MKKSYLSLERALEQRARDIKLSIWAEAHGLDRERTETHIEFLQRVLDAKQRQEQLDDGYGMGC